MCDVKEDDFATIGLVDFLLLNQRSLIPPKAPPQVRSHRCLKSRTDLDRKIPYPCLKMKMKGRIT